MAKIFILDDDAMVTSLLRDLLEGSGHVVENADSSAQCLPSLRAGAFDLAILDIDMPQISGLELLRLIRREPALRKLPVLMCTGRSKVADLDVAFDSGATGYIVKPFTLESLSGSVAKALSAKV